MAHVQAEEDGQQQQHVEGLEQQENLLHAAFADGSAADYGPDTAATTGASYDQSQASLSQSEFKRQLQLQLQSSGVLGAVKGQLRAQLLAQLSKQRVVNLSAAGAGAAGVSLKRRALNSLLVEYLAAAPYQFTLSVFSEESGTGPSPPLSEAEVLEVLRVEPASLLHQAFVRAKHQHQQQQGVLRALPQQQAQGAAAVGPACVLLSLLDALAEVGRATRGLESGTQTAGDHRYNLELKMQQLEYEHEARQRSQRMGTAQAREARGIEERMALYRQQLEEQAKADVARQVERIREVEVSSVRLEEAAKWRRALEGERQELERLHSERLAKLRGREEEVGEKLRRQQRDVEAVAFEHRQRLLREEERLRAWKGEAQAALDGREEQLKHLARALDLREKAVVAREVAAESKAAEAAQALGTAHVNARAEVEKEYLELKATLSAQRLQLEMDRARVAELRSEAAAELAAARAKEDRLRALEAARAEAEARAAAHAAETEILRLQAERLHAELGAARDELQRKVALAADNADAMLSNAAGALGMLGKEAQQQRALSGQLRALQEELDAAQAAAQRAEHARRAAEEARAAAAGRAETLQLQVKELTHQLQEMGQLAEQALEAREVALREADDAAFALSQTQQELTHARQALNRAREDALASRLFGGAATGPSPPLSALPGPGAGAGRAAGGLPPPPQSVRSSLQLDLGALGGGAARTPTGQAANPTLAVGGGWPAPSGVAALSPSAAAALLLQPRQPYATFGAPLPAGVLVDPALYAGLSPRQGSSMPSSSRPHTGSGAAAAAAAAGGPSVPSVPPALSPKGAAGDGATPPLSPTRERMHRLAQAEQEVAAELAGFKRRVAEQRESSARELQLVMTRVALGTAPGAPPSPSARTSLSGQLTGLDAAAAVAAGLGGPQGGGGSPHASRSPSRRTLSPSQSHVGGAAATLALGAMRPQPPPPDPHVPPRAPTPTGSFSAAPAPLPPPPAWAAAPEPAAPFVAPPVAQSWTQPAAAPAASSDAPPPPPPLQQPPQAQPAASSASSAHPAGSQGGFGSLATPPATTAADPSATSAAPQHAQQHRRGSADAHPSLSFSDIPTPPGGAAASAATGIIGGAPLPVAAAPKAGLPPLSSVPQLPAAAAASVAAAPPAPAAAVAAPPPGLVLVAQLAPAATAAAAGGAAQGQRGAAGEEASQPGGQSGEGLGGGRTFVGSGSMDDVRNAQAAKLRMLQEQQEARLAAQRAEQEEREREEARERARLSQAAAEAAARSAAFDDQEEEEEEEYEEDFVKQEAADSPRSSHGSSRAPRVAVAGRRAGTAAGGRARHQSGSGSGGGSDDSRQRTGRTVVDAARAAQGLDSRSAQLRLDSDEDADDDDDDLVQLEAAGAFDQRSSAQTAERPVLRAASDDEDDDDSGGGGLEGPEVTQGGGGGGGGRDSDSIPSALGDLDLSVGDESGLIVDLDGDESDEHALGGTALGASSDSVF